MAQTPNPCDETFSAFTRTAADFQLRMDTPVDRRILGSWKQYDFCKYQQAFAKTLVYAGAAGPHHRWVSDVTNVIIQTPRPLAQIKELAVQAAVGERLYIETVGNPPAYPWTAPVSRGASHDHGDPMAPMTGGLELIYYDAQEDECRFVFKGLPGLYYKLCPCFG